MIINKKIAFLSLALIALFSLALSASADTSNDALIEKDRATISADDDELDLSDLDNLDEDLNDIDESLNDFDKKLDDVDGRSKSDERRSEVGDIAEKLEKIADRVARDADEVGDDLDEIVKELKESEEKVAKAMDEVEKRDSLKTFFFGTDYKNLGELRSTLVTTDNHIERLMRAASSTTDMTVRASLMAEIQALEDTASSTEVFIRDNEGKFSLFGWFVRIFN